MKLLGKIPEEIKRQGWLRLGGVLILAMALASVQAPAQQLATPLAAAGESVIAPELAQAHPVIAQYHTWVRGGAMVPFLAGQVETVLDYWRAIGVQANLKLTEQTAFQAMFRSKTWKGVMAGATVGAGTSLNTYVMKVHSQGPENYAGVNDAELDRLIEAQQQEFDLEKRKALARQIRERELDKVYRLSVSMYYFAEFIKPYVRNWVTHELYMFQHGWGAHSMEYTWLDR
jgi:ABC-type oligopeptide transport system substrate-binding subunit